MYSFAIVESIADKVVSQCNRSQRIIVNNSINELKLSDHSIRLQKMSQSFGIFNYIVATVFVSLLALLFAAIIGIGGALFLAVCAPEWVRREGGMALELGNTDAAYNQRRHVASSRISPGHLRNASCGFLSSASD